MLQSSRHLATEQPLLYINNLLIFFCFFFVLSFKTLSAEYQWVEVLKTNNGNIFFIDKNSINKKKDKIFFIKLHEYAIVNDFGEKSSIIHHQADCSKFRIKYLKDFYYKLPMGKGELSYFGDEESKWIEAKENTILLSFLNFVCNY